jgi:hypothetical protein
MKAFYFFPAAMLFFSGAIAQPCEGPPFLKEDFTNGIPNNWTVISNDNCQLIPSLIARGYTGTLQAFTHQGQLCVANASSYTSSCQTNDWLITPQLTLGTGPGPLCLSWKASSMYPFYAEEYEVRISTAGPNVNDMMVNPPLYVQTGEPLGWNQYNVDMSFYAGQTVYIGFWHKSLDKFAFYLDDIRITQPVSRDVSVKSLSIGEVVTQGSYPLTGELLNGGTTLISSMDLHWNVNNGPVNTVSLFSLFIPQASFYNYAHSINWNPSANGAYILKIWASNINGQPDQYTANDTLTQLVFVHSNPRVILVEEFTNTDCPPCATQNPAFDALLEQNRIAGKMSMIKYHAPWPGPNDPMNVFNTLDIADRLYYYASPGLPNGLINGILIPNDCGNYLGAPACLDQTDIDSVYAIPSVFQIQIANNVSGNDMIMNITVTSLVNNPLTSLKLRTVVVEDTILYSTPPGTNGETDFYQVMRAMMPNETGTTLPPMTANQTMSFNFVWPINSPADPSQLRTVAFIQDDNNHKVYQSSITNFITVGMKEYLQDISVSLYPNPSSTYINIACNVGIEHVYVFNMLGEKVDEWQVNGKFFNGNIAAFSSGIYLVKIFTEKGTVLKKIVKE